MGESKKSIRKFMTGGKKEKERDKSKWMKWLAAFFVAVSFFSSFAMESKAAQTYTCEVADVTFTYTTDESGNACITGYSGTAETITIPESVDGKTVSEIGAGAFSRCTAMKSITIPKTVTKIGSSAFYNCSNLESVTIPANVTAINNFTFSGCKKLKNVTFAGESQLKTIGYQAFYNCALTSVTIPKQVSSIDTDAFSGCEQMKIQVASGNPYYSSDEAGALYNKEKTTLILCPYTGSEYAVADTVKIIGQYAFACNSIVENITLPKGVETIENEAFYNCTALETIVLPDTVKNIGRNALDTHGYYPVVYYPNNLDLTEADIPGDMLQISYLVNSDRTVSVTVQSVPNGYLDLVLPGNIMGMAISSLEYASGVNTSKIVLRCTNHFSSDGEWEYNEEKHWFSTCSVCGLGGGVREYHDYADSNCACRCGYVPFKLTTSTKDTTLTYGESYTICVETEATLGGEEITYQWYRDGKVIQGAVLPQYTVAADTEPGTYTYVCKVTSKDYSINSDKIRIQINKAQNPPNMPETVMKVPYTNTKVGDVPLGEGWKWVDAYKKISLKIGIGVKVIAVYDGAGKGNYVNEKVSVTITRELKKGTVITDTKSKAQYKVTKSGTAGVEVQYVKSTSKTAKTIVIPAVITSKGVSCKVTSIAAKAFKNNKKITKVTIGKNVKKIGKQAFYGCKKLKKITIKTTKLTNKNVGSKAFTGTSATAKVKVPAKKLSAYKSMLRKKGISKKVSITK